MFPFDPSAIISVALLLLAVASFGLALAVAIFAALRSLSAPYGYGEPPRWIVNEMRRRVAKIEQRKKFDEVLADLADELPPDEDLDA